MKKDTTILKSIIVPQIFMTAGGLLLCGLIGLLVSKQVVPAGMSATAIMVLIETLVLACVYTVARKQTKKRLPIALLVSAIYISIRLLVGTIFFSGEKLQVFGCLVTLGTGIVAGILSGMKKQRRR